MDYTRFEDNVLMRLVAQAQPDALSELYDRYSRLVYGLAWNIVGDAASAEEVTQDTFLNAWEHASSYQPELGKVSTWLARIARNRAIDMLRKSSARRENHQVSIEEMPSLNLSGPQNVEYEVDSLNGQERVRWALAQLPHDQQEALILAYFKGLTQEQVAQVLGQPLGTVKTRIRLGMIKLRHILVEEKTDEKDN